MFPLTFAQLREANTLRLPQFKNKHGHAAHSEPDGSDWSPAQWLQAVVGELGEFANLRKKYERGDLGDTEYQALAAKELADVMTYFDILAKRAFDYPEGNPHPEGVDLGRAVAEKFNEVSLRVGARVCFTTYYGKMGALACSVSETLPVANLQKESS